MFFHEYNDVGYDRSGGNFGASLGKKNWIACASNISYSKNNEMRKRRLYHLKIVLGYPFFSKSRCICMNNFNLYLISFLEINVDIHVEINESLKLKKKSWSTVHCFLRAARNTFQYRVLCAILFWKTLRFLYKISRFFQNWGQKSISSTINTFDVRLTLTWFSYLKKMWIQYHLITKTYFGNLTHGWTWPWRYGKKWSTD